MNEIDVSKCELIYNDGRCFASQRQGVGYSCHKSDYCKYNSNCYYKQLQQLKAENKEIRKINNANAKLMVRLRDCLDEIEEHIKTCHNTMYCKDCKFLENCQYMNGYDWSEIILQKIKQVKKGVK